MGEVYRAYDTSHNRFVALKLLARQFTADDQYKARFRQESEVAAQLREPHVIPIHRYGEINGRLYIDMRLVDGDSLATVLARDGPISPSRTLLIVEQVASALDAAHAEGLIHRDVKPSNVLLSRTPAGHDFVYLADFGIARLLTRSATTSLTEAGAMIGTPEYMPPERFENGLIDRKTDIYALACLIYECLTGQAPFPMKDLPALIYAHLNTPPPRPSEVRPSIPKNVDAVVAKGMAKKPASRYSSAGHLASALRSALEKDIVARAQPKRRLAFFSNLPVRRHERLVRRRWATTFVVAIIVASIGIVIWELWGPMRRPIILQPNPPPTPSIDGTISVGSMPEAIAITPDGKNAYVSNIDSKDISVIDTSKNMTTSTIPIVAGPPQYLAISPDGKRIYVTLYDPTAGIHAVAVIDASAKIVSAIIPVGLRPYGLATTPDGSEVYVADHDSAAISVIDAMTNKVAGTIAVAPNPHWIAFSPDGRTAYVANHESNVMSVIDTATRSVTSVVSTGRSPHSVAVSPDGRQVDVADYDSNAVTVIDAFRRTVSATVPVGTNPRCVAYSPDGRSVYIVSEGSDTLAIIDARTNILADNVVIGHSPTVGVVSPNGHRVYVVNQGSNTVSVVRVASSG